MNPRPSYILIATVGAVTSTKVVTNVSVGGSFSPTELQNIAVALDARGQNAAAVQPLFITVDPERDTVESLADYVANFTRAGTDRRAMADARNEGQDYTGQTSYAGRIVQTVRPGRCIPEAMALARRAPESE